MAASKSPPSIRRWTPLASGQSRVVRPQPAPQSGTSFLRRHVIAALPHTVDATAVAFDRTGAFLAAQAGLLDGCRATTHWAHADDLAREFPTIDVDPDPIFVRSSPKVWTAAGVCSGIDLALALVEEDHGTEVAQTVARHLVMHLRRPGGQTQFAAPVWVARAKRDPIRAVQRASSRVKPCPVGPVP